MQPLVSLTLQSALQVTLYNIERENEAFLPEERNSNSWGQLSTTICFISDIIYFLYSFQYRKRVELLPEFHN